MAQALRLTAPDLKEFDVIDEIIPEPAGAAHSDPQGTIDAVGTVLERQLGELATLSADELLEDRYQRFRRIGRFTELHA